MTFSLNYQHCSQQLKNLITNLAPEGYRRGMLSAMRDTAVYASKNHKHIRRTANLEGSVRSGIKPDNLTGYIEIDTGLKNTKDYAKAVYFGQKSTGKINYVKPWQGDPFLDEAMIKNKDANVRKIETEISKLIRKELNK